MRLLTAGEMRQADRAASTVHGVPVARLMENAGRAVAEIARAQSASGRVVVYAGAGNNGGDGFVAARRLREAGLSVEVWLAVPAERISGEARENLDRLRGLGVAVAGGAPPALRRGDLGLDALLGTGLSRPPEGRFSEGIRALNAGREAGARVIAVDVPSGLDADTGRTPGLCVAAHLTVTLGAAKRGLALEPGASLAGEIRVGDIGIPAEALLAISSRVERLDEDDVRGLFRPRPREAHKGEEGHLLVVAGSPGKAGAAALAVRGGLRGGGGLVTLASRRAVVDRLWTVAPEAMGAALPGEGPLALGDLPALRAAAEGKDALAVGPGLPRGSETAECLAGLLAGFDGPAVLDADALNALAGRLDLLGRAKGPIVVTPHPGEMARLAGRTVAEVQADRIGAAQALAEEHGVTVVLKGARTVVASEGAVWIVPTGNPGMATGGTGDVLCGLVGALLAQRHPAAEAARAAAYVHGLAGDLAAARRGERGLIASDVAEAIGEVWSRWRL